MTTIGAEAQVVWKNHNPEDWEYWYISFGKYDDESGCDSFGVADYHIAYYAEGEEELQEMMREDSGHDWVILYYHTVAGSEA